MYICHKSALKTCKKVERSEIEHKTSCIAHKNANDCIMNGRIYKKAPKNTENHMEIKHILGFPGHIPNCKPLHLSWTSRRYDQ